ncbi:ATP-dependent DNA helicase [Xanthocytophaga agilis]|uniref:AAA family ATPase n=1 Tax=Xanthocytophaga agilis TaxID=3048010 RepID=A0AAE3UE53_9BACT|nr:AAA family ATPase [Xanthocytophaga agilis]MDJ1499023.1 AAA family ATPase [Xanthocytophaga agilis]
MPVTTSLAELLKQKFPHTPTQGQAELFEMLDEFIADKEILLPVFLLRGYAGTGKTTILSTLVKIIKKFGYKTILMAPTGRAAKVMAQYSGKKAWTIHKKIFWQKTDAYSGNMVFERQPNYNTSTLFIIDEASMIDDEADFMGGRGLLAELIDYVFEHPSNKLLLVGDAAQLPPVGKTLSPALDSSYLQRTYDISVREKELTEVTRQGEASGILHNATYIRNSLINLKLTIELQTRGFRDCYKMTGERLEDGLRYAYDKFGRENTIIITRSNKTAVQYNQYIRRQINSSESEIDAGDLLMVVRNNYTVLGEDAPAGFIANGDFVEIKKVRSFEEMHGFRFANVELTLIDYPEYPSFEAKILLDTLHTVAASLSSEDNKKLYDSVLQDYTHIPRKTERVEAIRKDPYLNALQVKFAYALTCHKSQGGQWSAVFVDQGYLTDENLNAEFLRWLYTAITRATEEVYFMNFHTKFFNS